MKKWMLKAIIQGFLSIFPQSEKWNFLFQKYVTRKAILPTSRVQRRIDWCAKHIEYYQTYSPNDWPPTSVLELGTGWFPTVPICLYLCGVDQIYTVDIYRLINPDTLRQTLNIFRQIIQEHKLGEVLPVFSQERTQDVVRLAGTYDKQPIPETLANLHIEYLICDARNLPLTDSSIGFIVSNTTLEHIASEIIQGIFQEFYRVASPNALMSHLIDISDHYSHFDSSITPLNYLKYSSKQWRFFNTPLQYQNRLRISQYRKLHTYAKFEIVSEMNNFVSPETLANINVADLFKDFTEDDLLGTQTWMLAQKT